VISAFFGPGTAKIRFDKIRVYLLNPSARLQLSIIAGELLLESTTQSAVIGQDSGSPMHNAALMFDIPKSLAIVRVVSNSNTTVFATGFATGPFSATTPITFTCEVDFWFLA
jgi:hypothetical protein